MKKTVSLNLISRHLNVSMFGRHKIVLVTGCFDILHSEHRKFLKAAKKQGDVLIVGLESDKRVRQLKGKDRPLNCWKIRAKNLAKSNEVDFIFLLPEKFSASWEHLKLLQLIKPSILAVSENTPHIKEKRMLMKKINGRLKVVLSHNPKTSTTKLLHNKTVR